MMHKSRPTFWIPQKVYGGALGPIDGLTYLADGGYILASKTENRITLRGTVPNEDSRAALLASGAKATDGAVEDQLTISGPVAPWRGEAAFGVGQLAGLTTGTVTVAAGAFALSGLADSGADDVRGAVAGRDGWQAFESSPRLADDLSEEVAHDDTIAALNGTIDETRGQAAELQTNVQDHDTLIISLQNQVHVASNAAQCAAQGNAVMDNSQINFRTAIAKIDDG